jgi:hypothetical protein
LYRSRQLPGSLDRGDRGVTTLSKESKFTNDFRRFPYRTPVSRIYTQPTRMNRQVRLTFGLGILVATSAGCPAPDQFYRHRDAGGAGVVGAGGRDAGLTGLGGTTASAGSGGAAGTSALGGAFGSAGRDAGSDLTAGAAGANAGATGTAGTIGGAGSTGVAGTGGRDAGSAGATGSGGRDASGAGGTAGSSGSDASADQAAPACTSTPDCHCETYGGHAYKFCGAGRGFVAAHDDCAAQGMRLIRVDDEAENQWAFATKVAKGFPGVWIGASDMATEGDWRWSDDTPFWTGKAGVAGSGSVDALFNAWQTSPAQPDQNGEEDCAGFSYSNDRWADLVCTDHNAYICELY